MTDGWRELYDTEYPRLLRALLAIGGDPDAAEDAAQEAFVKAHKQGLATLERPGAWLLVVGTRELLRQRRRRRVEDEVARYYYGLSYDEIAEHFDIKSGTVGATLHQAIEKLRQTQMAGRLARGAMR
jgi:DNA-directed RNA polymerase specialized sigma24 family protein